MKKMSLYTQGQTCCYLTIFILVAFFSCYKKIPCNCPLPVDRRDGYIIEFTWGLISETSIDSLSSGKFHKYKGNRSDSLHFFWNLNPNLNIYAVCSFIQQYGDSTVSYIDSYTSATGVAFNDTSTIAYDTIIMATPWRLNYSDTLFVSKVSPFTLVFRVNYADSTGRGVEVDSFRNIGLFRPF